MWSTPDRLHVGLAKNAWCLSCDGADAELTTNVLEMPLPQTIPRHAEKEASFAADPPPGDNHIDAPSEVLRNTDRCLKEPSSDDQHRELSAELRGVHGLKTDFAGNVGRKTGDDVPEIVRLVEMRADVLLVVRRWKPRNALRVEAVPTKEVGE